MIHVRVFDPAMCCSTGICGPSVDPKLTRFAADLDWLKDQGVSVERFNLAQQPAAFAADAAVKAALEARGEDSLPLIAIDGAVKSSGTYPTREELAAWAGVQLETMAKATSSGCCGPKTEAMQEQAAPKASGCCGPSERAEPKTAKSGCC
jgi:hypothetical protein